MDPRLQDFDIYQNTASMQDYLEKSFASKLLRYSPNGQCPLFGLTGKLPEAKAKSVEHGYFAKTMVFIGATLAGAVADGAATNFVVVSTANILPGDLLRAQSTGEIVRVTAVVDATNLTVSRGVGQIAAAAISNGVALYGVGNAFEQASLRPNSRLMNPVRVMNFTQIFRNSWALPATMTAIMPIVGDSLSAESKTDCAMFHGSDIERSILFGQRSSGFVNNQYMTTMDGIVETVRRLAPAANTNTAGATTNYVQLEGFLNPVFDTQTNGRNGNSRLLFVGGTARTVINTIGRLSGQYQIVDGQTNFGLQFSTFRTSRGMFTMIEHPMLNSNVDWKKMAIAVDMEAIKLPYLRKTKHEQYGINGQLADNGADAVGGTLTTELTMEIGNPSAHAVVYGLTAGA